MSVNRKVLVQDLDRMEDVMSKTSNDLEHRFSYYIALAVYHILTWIIKNEDRKEMELDELRDKE